MWHLVHIITKLELGGAQLATLYEISHSKFGDGKRSLLYGPGGMLDQQAIDQKNIECFPIPALNREVVASNEIKALWQIYHVLKQLRQKNPKLPMIVHTHSSKAGILGRWAARLAGASIIVHSVHGYGHSHHGTKNFRQLYLIAEKITGRITSGFTADSAANIHQGHTEGLFGSAPAKVVRCGIDIKTFQRPITDRAKLKQELGIKNDHQIVLSLCCLKPQKDPLNLLRLAALVRKSNQKVIFLLAGDGELRPDIEKLHQELNLYQNFKLLGWRTDAAELLNISDLLVLNSKWEGLPQVFFQAMACGLPIVATRVDGAPEAIDHGINGLLYDVGDIEGIAQGIVELLNDATLRKQMGSVGKQQAHFFSQEKMVEDLDRFYGELLQYN